MKANQRKPYLFALIGIPASEKTTLAQEIQTNYPADYISSDDIREKKFGIKFSREIRDYVFAKMITLTIDAISCSCDVILDTTYLNTRLMRAQFFQEVQKADLQFWSIAICFCNVSVDSCIAFDQRRQVGRNVGKDIILAHAREIQFPSITEKMDFVVTNLAFQSMFIQGEIIKDRKLL